MPEQQTAVPDTPPSVEDRLRAYYKPKEEAAEAPESAPEPAEEREAPKAKVAPEETASEPQEAEKPESVEPSDDDTVSVETLADLAEYLGTDVSELYNIRIPVTSADGERAEVSISDWKDGYQATTRAQKLQQELEQKRAAFEREAQQAQERIKTTLTQTGKLLNAAERQLLNEYQSVDWERLRHDDPADWAAKRQDFMERQNAINAAKQEAVTEAQRLQQETEQQTQAQRSELLQKENERLLQRLPEWKDETKRKAEQAQLVEDLVSRGFDPKDVHSLSDHRMVLLARDAMLYRQQKEQGGAAKKKLVKVAKKVMKPGAAQAKGQQVAEREQALRAKLRKSGDIKDAFALLSARRSK